MTWHTIRPAKTSRRCCFYTAGAAIVASSALSSNTSPRDAPGCLGRPAGHGHSPTPSVYSVEAFATDVAALARRLGVRQVVAFGHSLGAMVALRAEPAGTRVGQRRSDGQSSPVEQRSLARVRCTAHTLLPGTRWTERPPQVRRANVPLHRRRRPRAHIIETMCAVPNDTAISMVEAMARSIRSLFCASAISQSS